MSAATAHGAGGRLDQCPGCSSQGTWRPGQEQEEDIPVLPPVLLPQGPCTVFSACSLK